MQNKIAVVQSNIYFLKQGISLLNSVTDDQYSFNNGTYFKSGIGRHFRHIIEHYLSLINGYKSKVNYDDRDRDIKLEKERVVAINALQSIISSITLFENEPELIDKQIEVMSNEGLSIENSPWSKATVRRELQFLISHTVHHYALIGLILKTMGVVVPEDFGIAPSTLKHESNQLETAQSS